MSTTDGSTTPTGPIQGGPLQAATPDRVNRRDSSMSTSRRQVCDSPVLDKISQFNSMSTTAHSKQLERKTAEAALKRAMMGREEAESEMRRLREENSMLRQHLGEGKERERKVGERLETIMDNYGRAKETHTHTQALWEKEIRRARKENFKTQSAIVKLQEELKTARTAAKINEESLKREKERSHAREQEAFTARYQIVGVQEQLEKALEKNKLVEQERDAFKTAAKNEEVARIAAEGRLPLPMTEGPDDEFGSPNKKLKKRKRDSTKDAPRVSLSTMEIVSSVASELEIEELTQQVTWERQRADRAQELIEFLQAECQMHCCPCSKSKAEASASSVKSLPGTRQVDRVVTLEIEMTPVQSSEDAAEAVQGIANGVETTPTELDRASLEPEKLLVKSRKERRSTIFCPKEGTFRTVSELEAAALEAQESATAQPTTRQEDVDIVLPDSVDPRLSSRIYARTPSVEPPSCALLARDRSSLQSLLHAPHGDEDDSSTAVLNIPTLADEEHVDEPAEAHSERLPGEPRPRSVDDARLGPESSPTLTPPEARSLSSSARYAVTTTTVPVRDEDPQRSSLFSEKLRTPSNTSNTSFDLNDPALTPTMTREQALAKIRERRGRARSIEKATATATPHKAKSLSRGRKDLSRPASKTSGKVRP